MNDDPGAKDSDDSDYRWLIARERGEDISHVPAAARAPYERLGELLGSGLAPRAGFRQRVLDAIDAEERGERPVLETKSDAVPELPPVPVPTPAPVAAPDPVVAPAVTAEAAVTAAARAAEKKVVPFRKKSPWRWVAAGGLAAAAAAAVVLFATSARRGAEPAPLLAVKSERRAGSTVYRADPDSDQVNIGEPLVVRAQVHGSGEIRVYGGSNNELLGSCKHPGDCAIEGDGEHRWIVLEVKLEGPGTVRAVVFAGEQIPASTGSYESDLEAAGRADVRYEIGKKVWRVP